MPPFRICHGKKPSLIARARPLRNFAAKHGLGHYDRFFFSSFSASQRGSATVGAQLQAPSTFRFLPQFGQYPVALVITDLGLSFGDRNFVGPTVTTQRTINQIKRLLQMLRDRFQASRAIGFEVAGKITNQTDIWHNNFSAVMFPNQLRSALRFQCSDLPKVRAKINGPWPEFLLKFQRPEF
jgi:hypothetical protein